jgi:hypothetical protein
LLTPLAMMAFMKQRKSEVEQDARKASQSS